jgi:predicted unusual protein kinase regulating ubiquinone biosynthesis (AarF/ABC1/UbiB family)
VRSAERHFWCLPLASPRPLVAAGRQLQRASVLVREHVEGRTLRELWDSPAGLGAREEGELASFLAAMERHRVIHGDLHPRNLLWNGSAWLLLDVDGLRHGLHDSRRVLTALWARLLVHLGDERRVRALHARAAEELGSAASVAWPDIERAGERMRARRGGVPAA